MLFQHWLFYRNHLSAKMSLNPRHTWSAEVSSPTDYLFRFRGWTWDNCEQGQFFLFPGNQKPSTKRTYMHTVHTTYIFVSHRKKKYCKCYHCIYILYIRYKCHTGYLLYWLIHILFRYMSVSRPLAGRCIILCSRLYTEAPCRQDYNLKLRPWQTPAVASLCLSLVVGSIDTQPTCSFPGSSQTRLFNPLRVDVLQFSNLFF